MGRVTVFGFETSSRQDDATANDLDLSREYAHQEELCLDSAWTSDSSRPGVGANDGLSSETTSGITVKQFILVELEHPVTCAKHSLMIGSRLDTDIHSNTCRLAFHGRIVMLLSDVNYKETILPQLKVSWFCPIFHQVPSSSICFLATDICCFIGTTHCVTVCVRRK